MSRKHGLDRFTSWGLAWGAACVALYTSPLQAGPILVSAFSAIEQGLSVTPRGAVDIGAYAAAGSAPSWYRGGEFTITGSNVSRAGVSYERLLKPYTIEATLAGNPFSVEGKGVFNRAIAVPRNRTAKAGLLAARALDGDAAPSQIRSASIGSWFSVAATDPQDPANKQYGIVSTGVAVIEGGPEASDQTVATAATSVAFDVRLPAGEVALSPRLETLDLETNMRRAGIVYDARAKTDLGRDGPLWSLHVEVRPHLALIVQFTSDPILGLNDTDIIKYLTKELDPLNTADGSYSLASGISLFEASFTSRKPFIYSLDTLTLVTLNVPEPGSLALLWLGLFGLAAFRRSAAADHEMTSHRPDRQTRSGQTLADPRAKHHDFLSV